MHFPKDFPLLRGARIHMADLSNVTVDEFMPIAMKSGKMVTDREKVSALIENLAKGFQDEHTLCWGIFIDSQLIGMCGYFRGFADQVGEIGYILNAEYRGQGFMHEAMTLALDFGWTSLGLKKIIAITAKDNFPSIHLLETSGFNKSKAKLEADVEFEIRRPTS